MTQPQPQLEFIVPTELIDQLKARIRQEVPDVLIGTKDLQDGTCYLTVTPFSLTPQVAGQIRDVVSRFKDEAVLSGEKPQETSLSELVQRVREAHGEV